MIFNEVWNVTAFWKCIILFISKRLLITDGSRFFSIKETDNNKYIIHVGRFRFNSSVEIVCNLPNFIHKFFCNRRILAEFFSLHDNLANLNISRIFSSHLYFFRLQIGGLIVISDKDIVLWMAYTHYVWYLQAVWIYSRVVHSKGNYFVIIRTEILFCFTVFALVRFGRDS